MSNYTQESHFATVNWSDNAEGFWNGDQILDARAATILVPSVLATPSERLDANEDVWVLSKEQAQLLEELMQQRGDEPVLLASYEDAVAREWIEALDTTRSELEDFARSHPDWSLEDRSEDVALWEPAARVGVAYDPAERSWCLLDHEGYPIDVIPGTAWSVDEYIDGVEDAIKAITKTLESLEEE